MRLKWKFKWSKVTDAVKTNGLGVLLDTLNAASTAADMASLPPLKLACEAAIQIIQIVQTMNQQKGSCKDLADQSARRLLTLYRTFIHIKNELSEELNLESLLKSVEEFAKNLEDGRKVTQDLYGKGFVYRLLNRASIQETITNLLSEQKYAFETFMMQSNIRTEANTKAILVQVEVKDTSTGAWVFENSDVTPTEDRPPDLALERHKAYYVTAVRRDGLVKPVLMLRLHSNSSEAEYRRQYKHLNQFNDPSIAHLYGIASKRSPTKFMLFDNALDIIPYNTFRNSTRGEDYVRFNDNYEQDFNSAFHYLKSEKNLDGIYLELIFTQTRMVKGKGSALIFVPVPAADEDEKKEKIKSVLLSVNAMLDRRLSALPRVTRCSECLPNTKGFYMGLLNAIKRSLGNLEPLPDLGDEFSSVFSSLRNAEELLTQAVDTVMARSQTKPFVHKSCGFCGKHLVDDESQQASGSRIEVVE